MDCMQKGNQIFQADVVQNALSKAQGFMDLMMCYNCALMEVETKLKVLSAELSATQDYNPFESIKTRLKSPQSIIEKMNRRGYELTVESIEEHLFDIAGARVICAFPEDIYVLEECLSSQDDIKVIERKDYIEHPKPNGYRSLHLILEVPIFLSTGKKYMKVEVQLRTIAMDFWASLEHKLKYKKHVENPEYIARELKDCADSINATDHRMQEIRKMIGEHLDDDPLTPNEKSVPAEADIDAAFGDVIGEGNEGRASR